MSDSDSDKEQKMDLDLPPYRLRHSDMPLKLVKEVVRQIDKLFLKFPLDKDVCVELVKYIKAQPQFKIGDGEWQCIIGTHFGCSLTFDLHVLTFFDFVKNGKTILLFKSG